MKSVATATAIALALCLPAVAAAAPKAASPARQCFSVRGSNNHFSPVDRETLNVGVNGNEVWQLKYLGPCTDADWTLTAALRSRSGGSFVCSPDDVDLIVPSPLGQQVCRVTALRKLTPDEVAALPRKQRP